MSWQARAGVVLALATVACLPASIAALNQREPDPDVTASASPTPPADSYLRIADFAEWRIDGRKYLVRDVDRSGAAAKLTYLEYSFGDVSADGRCVGDAEHDYQRQFSADESVDGKGDTAGQPLAGNFNQLRKLKEKHPQLKVTFSIGGWGGSENFSDAALTPESRRRFVASCVDRALKGNLPKVGGRPQGGDGAGAGIFDGIDVDWEWPGSEGGAGSVVRPADKRNFTLLLAEFRRQLDAFGEEVGRRFALSTFVSDDPARIRAGFEPKEIFQYLDYASVNGFDLHGPWDRTTNHSAQLFTPKADPSAQQSSVDAAVRTWLDAGAPPRKLSVSVSAFGHGWRGVPATNNGLYQRSGGPAPGGYQDGDEDYRILAKRGGEHFRDTANGAHWLYNGDEWWSYDDPEVIRQKAAYVKKHGLGGMTLWSLDADDPSASLLTAVDEGLR
jgi:chitinase